MMRTICYSIINFFYISNHLITSFSVFFRKLFNSFIAYAYNCCFRWFTEVTFSLACITKHMICWNRCSRNRCNYSIEGFRLIDCIIFSLKSSILPYKRESTYLNWKLDRWKKFSLFSSLLFVIFFSSSLKYYLNWLKF